MDRNKTVLRALCAFATCGLGALFAATPLPAAPQPAQPAIAWLDNYEQAVAQARAQNKPLMIDFHAQWCAPCKMLDQQVFTDERVIAATTGWICVKVDTDERMDVALAYKNRSIPRTIIINTAGEIIGDHIGFVPADEFLKFFEHAEPYLYEAASAQPMPIVPPPPQVIAAEQQIAAMQGAAAKELIEYLSHADPTVRAEAIRLMVARQAETRPLIEAALSHEYLGARIAAYSALRQMGIEDFGYDPWAPKAQRQAILQQWREAAP